MRTPARRLRDSWVVLVLATASRVYLTMVLSLVAIAVLPAIIGWQSSVVQSGSMAPDIEPGDVVVTTALAADKDVPVGRVVEFSNPAASDARGQASIRLHRIVSENADGTFVTKGDANQDVDSTSIQRQQIIGQARLLIPAIGLPGKWLASGDYPAFALWCAATVLAILAVTIDGARGESRRLTQKPLVATARHRLALGVH